MQTATESAYKGAAERLKGHGGVRRLAGFQNRTCSRLHEFLTLNAIPRGVSDLFPPNARILPAFDGGIAP